MLLFSVIVLTAEFRSDKAQILLQEDDDDEGPPACVLTNIPVITGLWWRHAKTHVPGSKNVRQQLKGFLKIRSKMNPRNMIPVV